MKSKDVWLCTIAEAERRSKLSRYTLHGLIQAKQLPASRMPSGRVLIPVAALDALRKGTAAA
ncbi:MAG: helix-turn-helix domain-containing protein [Bryobacteraceae bacterium]